MQAVKMVHSRGWVGVGVAGVEHLSRSSWVACRLASPPLWEGVMPVARKCGVQASSVTRPCVHPHKVACCLTKLVLQYLESSFRPAVVP